MASHLWVATKVTAEVSVEVGGGGGGFFFFQAEDGIRDC